MNRKNRTERKNPKKIRFFLFAPHANQSGGLQESCAASPEGREYEVKGVAGNGRV